MSEPELTSDCQLVNRCEELVDGSPALRWQLARELSGAWRKPSDGKLGPAYTTWREGGTYYLSFLPGLGQSGLGQRTYEFVTSVNPCSLRVQAIWQSPEPIWARVPFDEFHNGVQGLIADRSGCDLDREAVILICQQRGGTFDFPIGPPETGPETLCEWIAASPVSRTDLGWDRHPELELAGFGYSNFLLHSATGGAVLHVIVQGRWRTEAISALRETLQVMLPGRVSQVFVRFGCLRVDVFLGTVPAADGSGIIPATLRAAIDRTCAAVARAIAADELYSLPAPDPAWSVPTPNSADAGVFAAVLDTLGDAENPDSVRPIDEPAPWHPLRDIAPSDAYDEWGSWPRDLRESSLANYVSGKERSL